MKFLRVFIDRWLLKSGSTNIRSFGPFLLLQLIDNLLSRNYKLLLRIHTSIIFDLIKKKFQTFSASTQRTYNAFTMCFHFEDYKPCGECNGCVPPCFLLHLTNGNIIIFTWFLITSCVNLTIPYRLICSVIDQPFPLLTDFMSCKRYVSQKHWFFWCDFFLHLIIKVKKTFNVICQ